MTNQTKYFEGKNSLFGSIDVCVHINVMNNESCNEKKKKKNNFDGDIENVKCL